MIILSKTSEKNAEQIKTMCKNLKLLRKRKKWSVEELSKISEISVSDILRIENYGDCEIDTLYTLCRIYGIKLCEFFLPMGKPKKQ